MKQGVKDALKNWFLVLRCSGLGAFLGMIPGITGAVTDWIVYGHAMQTEKGAKETFTKGDVRGVIAPESANNAREGGMLVPMLAFGVPGGAVQAILLGAMMVHGFIPGPEILTKHLDLAYTMVWSIAIANVLGAGLCFMLSGQFAKIATLRYTLVLPVIMPIVYVGAFEGSHSWGDLFVLLIVRRARLDHEAPEMGTAAAGPGPGAGRAAGALHVDLVHALRHGVAVAARRHPPAGAVGAGLFQAAVQGVRTGRARRLRPLRQAALQARGPGYVFFIGIGLYALVTAQEWLFMAKIGPTVVACILVIAGTVSFAYKVFVVPAQAGPAPAASTWTWANDEKRCRTRWCWAGRRVLRLVPCLPRCMAVIGLIPTVPADHGGLHAHRGARALALSLILAACVTAFVYGVFDQIIHVPGQATSWADLAVIRREPAAGL
jgi:hypothetical protein